MPLERIPKDLVGRDAGEVMGPVSFPDARGNLRKGLGQGLLGFKGTKRFVDS